MRQDLAILALRLGLGAIFIVHAADKLGWHSISTVVGQDDLAAYTQHMLVAYENMLAGIFPNLDGTQITTLATTSALLEFACGWLLVLGILTRPAAFYLTIMMSVAVTFHFPHGFFASEGGYEWAMLCLVGSVSILLSGGGAFSLSHLTKVISTEETQAL